MNDSEFRGLTKWHLPLALAAASLIGLCGCHNTTQTNDQQVKQQWENAKKGPPPGYLEAKQMEMQDAQKASSAPAPTTPSGGQ